MASFRSVATTVRYVTEEARSMMVSLWRVFCTSGLTRCPTVFKYVIIFRRQRRFGGEENSIFMLEKIIHLF
jgi:hypothetical protein